MDAQTVWELVLSLIGIVSFFGVLFAASYAYAGPEGRAKELAKRIATLAASIVLAFVAARVSTWVFLRYGAGTVTANERDIREELSAEGFYTFADGVQDVSGKWYLNHTQTPTLVIQFSLPQEELEKLKWLEWAREGHHNPWFWPEFLGEYGLAAVESTDHYHATYCGHGGYHPHLFYTFTAPDETGMVDVIYISTYE